MGRMSISFRIYTGYAVIVALAVFIWFVGHSNSARMETELTNITDVNMKTLAALKDVKFHVRETIAALRAQLIPAITPEFRAAQRTLYEQNTGAMRKAIERLEGLRDKDRAEAEWQALLKQEQAFLAIVSKLEQKLDEWSQDTSDVLLSMEVLALAAVDVQKQSDLLLAALEQVIAKNDRLIAEDNADAKKAIQDGQRYALIAMLLAVGVAAVVGWLITGKIKKPLSVLVGYAGEVAAGNLDVKAKGAFIAELDQLKLSLEAMVDNLKDQISQAREKTAEAAEQARLAEDSSRQAREAQEAAEHARRDGMMEAAGQLLSVVENVVRAAATLEREVSLAAQAAQVQKQSLDKSMAALHDMDETIRQVTDEAGEASSTAENARGKAQEGASMISQVVGAIHGIKDNAASLKTNMADLSSRAGGIGRIMTVISDIADQTNLLALNAAIEAARAGEAGRGFAVVADEVRKLAEKTMSATREVDESIKGIQVGTQVSEQGVEHTAEAIAQVAGQVDAGGEALGEIVVLSRAVSDKIAAIDSAAGGQSRSSQGVLEAIKETSGYADKTAEGMSQAAEALSNLGGQLSELKEIIGRLSRG